MVRYLHGDQEEADATESGTMQTLTVKLAYTAEDCMLDFREVSYYSIHLLYRLIFNVAEEAVEGRG